MRQLLCYAVAFAMAILAFTADAATTTAKKKTYKKKTAVTARKTTAHKSTVSKSSKNSKKAPARKTTWRNRQLTPSPDRYKEIQNALVAKGYLQPEDASGSWNTASVDAMKKFQSAQNLDSSGKINSLSLIALGLGPKHDAAPVKPAETPQ
jgi:hypothetical protein